ncbi:hypothetical protein PENTCL1PPCAC_29863, partial [Pristionchus entomophagus]
ITTSVLHSSFVYVLYCFSLLHSKPSLGNRSEDTINTMMLLFAVASIAEATTCYKANVTTIPYAVLRKATVESQRGCEVLCDSDSQCAAFTFKEAGFSSGCVLLSTFTANLFCSTPKAIFLKNSTGCTDRTNLTLEFGIDPCIDERNDTAFRGFDGPICLQDNNRFVIRAIDASGRRITLDNDKWNQLKPVDGIWVWSYMNGAGNSYSTKIVAATCAAASAIKCPCEQLIMFSSNAGQYRALQDVLNPCREHPGTMLNTDVWKIQGASMRMSSSETAGSTIACK